MPAHHTHQRFLIGQLTFDSGSRELSSATETLYLEPQAYQLLSLFIAADQGQFQQLACRSKSDLTVLPQRTRSAVKLPPIKNPASTFSSRVNLTKPWPWQYHSWLVRGTSVKPFTGSV